jgi:hypothetical protein
MREIECIIKVEPIPLTPRIPRRENKVRSGHLEQLVAHVLILHLEVYNVSTTQPPTGTIHDTLESDIAKDK